jgi:hypothetical protein
VRSVVLLLVLSCLVVPRAHAACPAQGVNILPAPGSVVPTNTRFLLEGVGASADPVVALVGRVLWLRTSGHQVEVRVQRGWTSALGRSTVVLRLSEPLRAGLTYSLGLDEVLPGVRVLNGGRGGAPEWMGGRGADVAKPRWLKQPAVSEGLSRRTAEGSERFVKLRMTLLEDSPAYLVVTLSNRGGSVSSQHYVTPLHNGVALLGHDACGGGFALEEGKSYRAKLEVFDASGNTAPPVPVLAFEAPVANVENR